MTDEQIIELMARALCDAQQPFGAWERNESDGYRGIFRNEACAILTALRSAGMAVVPREPTEAMIDAAQSAWTPGVSYGEAHAIRYRAMINTAEGKIE